MGTVLFREDIEGKGEEASSEERSDSPKRDGRPAPLAVQEATGVPATLAAATTGLTPAVAVAVVLRDRASSGRVDAAVFGTYGVMDGSKSSLERSTMASPAMFRYQWEK